MECRSLKHQMSKVKRLFTDGFFRRNYIFIFILCMILMCIINGKVILPVSVVSNPDSQTSFNTNLKQLEQTWQANVKTISAVSIDYSATNDFQAEIELRFLSDRDELIAESLLINRFEANKTGTLTFPFKAIKVEPGERYKLQLSYKNFSQEGTILLPTGTNYSGCSIDGKDYNEAVNFKILFTKTSKIGWMFLTFFPFLSFALLGMILWKRKIEETIGLSFVMSVLLLYLFGLVEKLEVGIFVLYLLALLSFIFSVYLFNKKKLMPSELISPGLIMYIVIIGLILLNCRNVFMARWDEYSHWGLAVKDMFYYNSFSKHINTTVLLARYPPFSTLVEYFFTYTNGLFSYDLIYVGFQSTLVSLLMVICKSADRKIKYLVPSFAIIILIPIVFFADVYNSIYVDALLAVLVAYILICYYSEKMSWFNLLRIISGLIALTITKDIGLVLAGLLCLIILADIVYRNRRQNKRQWKLAAIPIVCMLIVLLTFASWQVYLSFPSKVSMNVNQESEIVGEKIAEEPLFNTPTIAASNISIKGIIDFLSLRGPDYQYQVLKNYIQVLFSEDTYSLGFSYIDLLILITLFAGGTRCWLIKENEGGRLLSLGILGFGAGLCYAGFLLVTYLFSFSTGEALLLHSHERYLGSYVGGITIAFMGIFLITISKEKSFGNKAKERYVIFAISGMILMGTPIEKFFVKNMDFEITEEEIYGYDNIEEAFRSFGLRGESVFFVCNGSQGYAYHMFKNTISPLLTSDEGWNIYASKERFLNQNKINSANNMETKGTPTYISVNEWEKILNSYNYVFLFHTDEAFKTSYSDLFDDPSTIGDGTMYSVEQNGESIVLSHIGTIGVKKFK